MLDIIGRCTIKYAHSAEPAVPTKADPSQTPKKRASHGAKQQFVKQLPYLPIAECRGVNMALMSKAKRAVWQRYYFVK